jgi:hypothetical protein
MYPLPRPLSRGTTFLLLVDLKKIQGTKNYQNDLVTLRKSSNVANCIFQEITRAWARWWQILGFSSFVAVYLTELYLTYLGCVDYLPGWTGPQNPIPWSNTTRQQSMTMCEVQFVFRSKHLGFWQDTWSKSPTI